MNKFAKSLLLMVAGGSLLTACSFFTTPLGSADNSAGSTQDKPTSVQVSNVEVESPQSKTEEVGLPPTLPSEQEDTDSGSNGVEQNESDESQNTDVSEPEEEGSSLDGTPDFGEGVSLVALTDAGALVPGQTFDVSIWVKPDGNGISAGEITLSFPSETVKAIDVRPGDLLGANALTGYRELSNDEGFVKIALARLGATEAPTDNGVLAVVSFRVEAGVSDGKYSIYLQSELADDEFHDLRPDSIDSASFSIQNN